MNPYISFRLPVGVLPLLLVSTLSPFQIASGQPLTTTNPEFAADAGADGSWTELVISPRPGTSAIYDPVRERIVVFGGYGGSYRNEVWALSLGHSPVWTTLTPIGATPNGRTGHSAIYDPVRDRMLVFGGSGGSSIHDDVWALSLDGPPVWTQLTPSGAPPSARYGHTAIYDPVRDRMLVFGGVATPSGVWALSLTGTPAWTMLTPGGTAPSARYNHSAIYDPVRDRMVLFGGFDQGAHNDIYALSLAGPGFWTELSPSGTPPSGRQGHCAIYDPLRDLMVTFGGDHEDDVWTLSLADTPAWEKLMPSGTPSTTRFGARAMYDPLNDRMLVFGETPDVFALALDAITWTEVTPTGNIPNPRAGHCAIYDPPRDRMVVFGGFDGSVYRNDVWAFALAGTPAWSQLAPSGIAPSARSGHSAIYDPVRDRMVVFAGYDGSENHNDVWELSLGGTPTWTALAPTGTSPSARREHSAIYDPMRDRMVIFGGSDEVTRNDVWELSLAGSPGWVVMTPNGMPPNGREQHSAIYDPERDRMVILGGFGGGADVWELVLTDAPAWAQLIPSGTPVGHVAHSAIYEPERGRMMVFAGHDGAFERNEVTMLSLAAPETWKTLRPTGTPPNPRSSHSLIYDPVRRRMIAFGGDYWPPFGKPYWLNDVWALSLSSIVSVDESGTRPPPIALRPPIPNPTAGPTTVSYSIAQAGHVQLGVYDVSGRLVRRLVDEERRAGTESVLWNGFDDSGSRIATGVFFLRLNGPGVRMTRKLVRLR